MPGEVSEFRGLDMAERMLPVRRYKTRIVDKVRLNRVTLIYAETGSGKSSQVPQMLLEEGLAPILCTQPRRLAVMAIAKHVAKDLNCTLGELVGYQIGQLNMTTSKSQIVFKTAGILLEDLRASGIAALSSYKVVILDEVHERSVESDLVLCCVKQFMLRNSRIRLVLMSATADFNKYEEYFKEISRDERVEVIAIPSIVSQLQQAMFECSVKYLEHVVGQLGQSSEHLHLIASIQKSPAPFESGIDMGIAIQMLIRDWIMHLHKSEADIRKSVLVFLPTYRALERQWSLLKATGLKLKLYILHSSIDMEHLMTAIEAFHEERKVILATNLAESSVTIPNVSFVVDSCRSLEVYWSNASKKHLPRLVWESQSQADQRKGRTGRTCSGIVFRMVPRSVYSLFEKFETPAMQLVSLRKQFLMLACAKSRAINDPRATFQRSMSPPQLETVENAFETLVNLHALEASTDQREKYQPSFYGLLLGNLPLSLESSMLVVKGAEAGFIRECGTLAVILDTSPYPIMQPYGGAKVIGNSDISGYSCQSFSSFKA
ncbi:hypothetical protein O6H91_Y065900 [Diphasiastrum complanatum]|nr:hypothetical protein O6H91_Y065900 [Diphasiastrum complanatum]